MSCSTLKLRDSYRALTDHACQRMDQRRITAADVAAVMQYGRHFYARGSVYHVLGRREIKRFLPIVDLQHLNGVHVISSFEGVVITVYRDREFQVKSLRSAKHNCGSRRAPNTRQSFSLIPDSQAR